MRKSNLGPVQIRDAGSGRRSSERLAQGQTCSWPGPLSLPTRRRTLLRSLGINANKGDRLFIGILSRLTHIDVSLLETIIDIDSDQIFDLPFLFAVSVGDWQLSPSQAERLGKYSISSRVSWSTIFTTNGRWARLMQGTHRIDSAAQAVELADGDSAFHVLFDLKERFRVPGANVVPGQASNGAARAGWRAILDPWGRMMVAISFNMDIGDGWEFADDPNYPRKILIPGDPPRH